MKGLIFGLMATSCVLGLSGCAASAAAVDGVADHQSHADTYVQSPINDGGEMAVKRTAPNAPTVPVIKAARTTRTTQIASRYK